MNEEGPTFEMHEGRPESSRVEFNTYIPHTLEDELFESEIEALTAIKRYKVSKFFNDRFIMGCLFSRKMDISRTVKMLKSHVKWRVSNKYERVPRWDELNKDLLSDNFAYIIPGTRSKDGSSILYAKLNRMVPGDYGKQFIKDIMDIMIWNNSVGTFYENLDFHRNGLIFIADLENFGLKNLDFSLQKKN